MTCSIDEITLPSQLFWAERYQDAGQAVATRRTIGGRNRVWAAARLGGRTITLEVNAPWCYLPDDTAEALHALAKLGEVHTLVLDDEFFWVRFRDPPLELSPAQPQRAPGGTLLGAKYWTGKINLLEM